LAVGATGKPEYTVDSGAVPAAEGDAPSLTQRTIGAARWRSASMFLQGVVQFAIGIALALSE
jgi:hypothetical protein